MKYRSFTTILFIVWSTQLVFSSPVSWKRFCKHRGEEIVILVESGGKNKNNNHNYSGFRKSNGNYYKFNSVDEWGNKFRKVMDKKYSIKAGESVRSWIRRISKIYNPQHHEEWTKRCLYHLNKSKPRK